MLQINGSTHATLWVRMLDTNYKPPKNAYKQQRENARDL